MIQLISVEKELPAIITVDNYPIIKELCYIRPLEYRPTVTC